MGCTSAKGKEFSQGAFPVKREGPPRLEPKPAVIPAALVETKVEPEVIQIEEPSVDKARFYSESSFPIPCSTDSCCGVKRFTYLAKTSRNGNVLLPLRNVYV